MTTYRIKTFILVFLIPIIILGILSIFDQSFNFFHKNVLDLTTWQQESKIIFGSAVFFLILKFLLPILISVILGIILTRKFKDNLVWIFVILTSIFMNCFSLLNIQNLIIPLQIDLLQNPRELNISKFSVISTRTKITNGSDYFRYSMQIGSEYLQIDNFNEDFKMKFNCERSGKEDDYTCSNNGKIYYLENLKILMKE